MDLLANGNLSCNVSNHPILLRNLCLLIQMSRLRIVNLTTFLHLSLILRKGLSYLREFCMGRLNGHLDFLPP